MHTYHESVLAVNVVRDERHGAVTALADPRGVEPDVHVLGHRVNLSGSVVKVGHAHERLPVEHGRDRRAEASTTHLLAEHLRTHQGAQELVALGVGPGRPDACHVRARVVLASGETGIAGTFDAQEGKQRGAVLVHGAEDVLPDCVHAVGRMRGYPDGRAATTLEDGNHGVEGVLVHKCHFLENHEVLGARATKILSSLVIFCHGSR